MGFEQYPITKVVEIEDKTLVVPLSTKFVTVDFTGHVEAHTSKPRPDDGWWVGDVRPTTVGVDKDWGFNIFEVG